MSILSPVIIAKRYTDNCSQESAQMEIEECIETYINLDIADGGLSDDTRKAYENNSRLFLNWCDKEGINIYTFTPVDGKKYRQFLISKGFMPATISLRLILARSVFTALALYGDFKGRNPFANIRPPRDKRDKAEMIKHLSLEQVNTLLDSLPTKNDLKSLRDKALISILISTGIRSVEAHRANCSDVIKGDYGAGIKVEGKHTIRTVPLLEKVVVNLDFYQQARSEKQDLKPDDPLFIAVGNRAGGQRLTRRGLRRVVDDYLKASGLKIEGVSTHTFRHTVGTLACQSGASIVQVQDLLGHKDIKTTSRYLQVQSRWEHNPAKLLELNL